MTRSTRRCARRGRTNIFFIRIVWLLGTDKALEGKQADILSEVSNRGRLESGAL